MSLSCHWAILTVIINFMMALIAMTMATSVRTLTFLSGAPGVSSSDVGSPGCVGPALASAWGERSVIRLYYCCVCQIMKTAWAALGNGNEMLNSISPGVTKKGGHRRPQHGGHKLQSHY